MRALLTILLTVLCSTYAFAHGNKTPIADSVLLSQLQDIDTELADYSHKSRALKGAYRILLYTAAIANNGFCPIAITSSPSDSDLADALEAIETGVNNNTQSYREAKKINRKLSKVLKKLIKRRTVDQNEVAELGFGIVGTFDYGVLPVQGVAGEVLVVTNGGTVPAVISNISYPLAPFLISLSSSTCAAGVTIQPGQSCEISTAVSSPSIGTFSGQISIDYDNGQGTANTTQNLQVTYQ